MRFRWLAQAGPLAWAAMVVLFVGLVGLDRWVKRQRPTPYLATVIFGVVVVGAFALLVLDPQLAFRQRVGVPVFVVAWAVLVGGAYVRFRQRDQTFALPSAPDVAATDVERYRATQPPWRRWSLLPYVGPHRSWATALSPDACIHHLHADVQPTSSQWARGRWAPLTQNPAIMRKLDQYRFQFLKLPLNDNPIGPWFLFGEIQVRGTTTVVSGQYRMPWYAKAGWFFYLAFGLGIALLFTVIVLRDNVLIPPGAIPKHTWLIVTFIPLGFIPLPMCWWRNRVEQANEAYMAVFVEQFFDGQPE